MAIAEIIKYEGDNSTFVWKYPLEDFNSLTTLIVHESQEAIFMMNGQTLDSFGPGRYTLNSENVPIIGKMVNLVTHDGVSPLHCEVYFINKTVQMAVKWGTDSKVRYVDPDYGVPIEIGASGEMNLEVSDGRKLLIKLVGTMKGIAWDNESNTFAQSLKISFRPLISTMIKSNLPTAIKQEQFDIFEIDEHLESLSNTLKTKIISGFEDYGLTIPEFYISNVILPEEDPNFKHLRELHAISLRTRMIKAEAQVKSVQALADADILVAQRISEMERQTTQTEVVKRQAERDLIQAQAEAQKTKLAGFAEAEIMAAKGYNQKDVLQAEVQKAYAEGLGDMGPDTVNGGGSSMMNDMMQIGLSMAAMQSIAPQMKDMISGFNPINNQVADGQTAKCSKCGTSISFNTKFCPECGESVIKTYEIVCPTCGAKVPKGKFCPECGKPLTPKCPNCGIEVAPSTKFCPECGTKI